MTALAGNVRPAASTSAMICNLRLSPKRYEAIKEAFTQGAAAWWVADHF
jgi:hypothetical protein